MTIWIDGKFLGGTSVPRSHAIAPFETMGAHLGQLPLWERHIARLSAAARRLGLPFAATPELRAAAASLLLHNGHADGVLRLALVPAADGSVATVMASRARSPVTVVKLLPTVVERPVDAPPGDLKAEPRRFWDLVLQQAQDGGADDGIVVDTDGALLECATGNLWFLVDGVWVTPALDGRVLPGVARALLLEAAARAGVAVAARRCGFDDLHRAAALAHSNAVYGPRPACLVDGEAAVALVHEQLGALWRLVTIQAGGT